MDCSLIIIAIVFLRGKHISCSQWKHGLLEVTIVVSVL